MFSRRSSFGVPHGWARALDEARSSGRPLVDLTESNPTRVGLPYEQDAIRGALAAPGALRYEPHPFGLPSARAAVAAHVGADPERVVLTASTSEAYRFLFDLLCDPGDEVLVPQPSYPLLEVLARLSSIDLVPYRLDYDGEWHIDLGSLRHARTTRARAVVTVSPNNPTGSFLAREELRALAGLGLPIVSDEVFTSYPLRPDDGRRARSALQATDVPVFVLGGLSKEAALPQMKLGWMVLGGPVPSVRGALERLEHIADAFLSAGAPVQHAVGRLLEVTRSTREAIRERTGRNLAALSRSVAGSAADVLRADGGWYAVVRVPRTADEEGWARALLDAGVVVQPGWLYDFERPGYLVISLLPAEEAFDSGAATLRQIVDRHA